MNKNIDAVLRDLKVYRSINGEDCIRLSDLQTAIAALAASPVELTDIDALMLLEPFDLKQPANVKISIVRAIQRHLAGDAAAQGGK